MEELVLVILSRARQIVNENTMPREGEGSKAHGASNFLGSQALTMGRGATAKVASTALDYNVDDGRQGIRGPWLYRSL